MTEKAAELLIVFRAKNLLKDALNKIGKDINDKLAKVREFQNEIRAVSKAALAVGVIGATLFTGAIVQAADFEKAMSNVSAVTNANIEDQKRLRDAAIEQGSKSVFSASQAADAQLFLGQAGQSTTEIISTLDGVLSLAAATSSDLAFTSEFTAATLSQFGLAAGEASRVANVFAASSSKSQANLNKLSFAMRQAGPDASSLGQNLEGTTAALNVFFDLGLKGEQAGTVLRAALVSLAKPSTEAAEVIERLGIEVFDAGGKMLPFVDIVEQLEKANLGAVDSFTIFGTEAGGKMAKLVSKGSEALREMERNIFGTDEAARQAAVRTDNLHGSINLLKSALEGASITIGDNYIPAILLATELVTSFISGFNDLDPAVQALIANAGLILTAITGLAGSFGLIVTAAAATTISIGIVGGALLSLTVLLAKGALLIGAFFVGFKIGEFLLNLKAAKLTAIDFLEAFEVGWISLKLVVNSVIAAMALGLQKTFEILRSTVLKPLDLIFEAAKKLKKSIDTNPFDSINSGLDSLQSHTESVVGDISKELSKVNEKYDEMREGVEKAAGGQEILKGATDKTSKSMKEQADAAKKLSDVNEEEAKRAQAHAEELQKAFDFVGLVNTDAAEKEMSDLIVVTNLLLESGKLTEQQEKELIKVFTEKANALSGATKRMEELTEASGEYNSAVDRLLSINLNTLSSNLDKALDGIINPKKIKDRAKEAEKILIAFSNRTDDSTLDTLKKIGQTTILPPEVLEEFKTRQAEGEKVLLKFKGTADGVTASVEKMSEGFSNVTTTTTEAELQIKKINNTIRASQNQVDSLLRGPIEAQAEYIELLNQTDASIKEVSDAENRFRELEMTRINGNLAAAEIGFEKLKALRAENLKDIEENNKKIADLEKVKLETTSALKEIDERRKAAAIGDREGGLSEEQRRQNELKRLDFQLQTVPGLPEEKQVEALRKIAEKSNEVSLKAKENGAQFRSALDIAEKAFRKIQDIQESDLTSAKSDGGGFDDKARRLEIATAAMGESIDGFQQKLVNLQVEIAETNLNIAVEMLDKATEPAKELKNNLLALFGTPIIQEISVRTHSLLKKEDIIGSPSDDSFFDDGPEFQTPSKDLTGFGPNVGFSPSFKDKNKSASSDFKSKSSSFATGIKLIPQDALVRVHKGERILTRSENDSERFGENGRGQPAVFQFGDINISGPLGTNLTPQEAAEQFMDEVEKIQNLRQG